MSKKVSIQNPNNLVNAINISDDNTITMTTLEIAELTNRRHDTVMRECDTNLSKVIKGGLHLFEETYIHPQNKQTYKYYRLPKREVLILVSGYSIELRTAIIDRLEYLEKQLAEQNKPKLPMTYEEALEDLLNKVRENKKLEAQNKELVIEIETNKPKVECYDRVMDTKGLLSIEEFAKIYKELKAGRNNIFKLLRDCKVLQSNNIPYQKYAHYFEIKESTYHKNEKEHLYNRVYIKLEYQEKLFNLLKKRLTSKSK